MSSASVMEPARSKQHTCLGFLKGCFAEGTVFEMRAQLKWSIGMLKHPWLSTEREKAHPSMKRHGLDMMLLDLVRVRLITEGVCDTSHSFRRAQSWPEPQQRLQAAGEMNTLNYLSFCSPISCLCLLLARSIWTPETGVPGLCRWSLNARASVLVRRRQKRVKTEEKEAME